MNGEWCFSQGWKIDEIMNGHGHLAAMEHKAGIEQVPGLRLGSGHGLGPGYWHNINTLSVHVGLPIDCTTSISRSFGSACHHNYISVLPKPLSETQPVIRIIWSHADHNPKHTWHLQHLLFYSVLAKSLIFQDYNLFVHILNSWDSSSVGDPSKIRPYSSLTGLLLSLFSLTAFSFRKPKNKRKAE